MVGYITGRAKSGIMRIRAWSIFLLDERRSTHTTGASRVCSSIGLSVEA
jgi:hypothetical protein